MLFWPKNLVLRPPLAVRPRMVMDAAKGCGPVLALGSGEGFELARTILSRRSSRAP